MKSAPEAEAMAIIAPASFSSRFSPTGRSKRARTSLVIRVIQATCSRVASSATGRSPRFWIISASMPLSLRILASDSAESSIRVRTPRRDTARRRERAELDHPDDGLPAGAYRGEERIHQAATRFSSDWAELKICRKFTSWRFGLSKLRNGTFCTREVSQARYSNGNL